MEVKTKVLEIKQNKDGSWYVDTDLPALPTEVVNEMLKGIYETNQKLPEIPSTLFKELRKKTVGCYFWFAVSVSLILLLLWR